LEDLDVALGSSGRDHRGPEKSLAISVPVGRNFQASRAADTRLTGFAVRRGRRGS
jgi:hypothetical protein